MTPHHENTPFDRLRMRREHESRKGWGKGADRENPKGAKARKGLREGGIAKGRKIEDQKGLPFSGFLTFGISRFRSLFVSSYFRAFVTENPFSTKR